MTHTLKKTNKNKGKKPFRISPWGYFWRNWTKVHYYLYIYMYLRIILILVLGVCLTNIVYLINKLRGKQISEEITKYCFARIKIWHRLHEVHWQVFVGNPWPVWNTIYEIDRGFPLRCSEFTIYNFVIFAEFLAVKHHFSYLVILLSRANIRKFTDIQSSYPSEIFNLLYIS